MKELCYTPAHVNLTLVEHSSVRGVSVRAHFCHTSLKLFMSTTNSHESCTLVGMTSVLMFSTLNKRVLILFLLTQKPRYLVSVHLKNDFSSFTSNTSSASLHRIFSSAFIWSTNLVFVIIGILYMYVRTIVNTLKSWDIVSRKILGLFQMPIVTFLNSYFTY